MGARLGYMRDRDRVRRLGKSYLHQRALSASSGLRTRRTRGGSSWRSPAAGQINDSGSHLLDILLWVTDLTVAEVAAFMDNKGTEVDIDSALSFRFTSGALGTISVVGDAPVWHEDITIWCEHGAFFYRNGALEFADADGKRTPIDGDTLPPTRTIDQDFLDAVRGKNPPAAPPLSAALRTIELTEAAWRSAAQNGAPVKMN